MLEKQYDLKYHPLEGKLLGKPFERQTEDAINDLGDIVIQVEESSGETSDLAEKAYQKAVEAETTADSALSAAQNAQQAADAAQATADSAEAKANAAQSAADNAQLTADTANQNATEAKTAAEVAQTDAAEALQTANTAEKDAEAAQLTADTALSAANANSESIANLSQEVDELNNYEVVGVVDLNNYYTEFSRIYVDAGSENAPTNTEKFYVDINVNLDMTIVRQVAIGAASGIIYIRNGALTEKEEDELKSNIGTTNEGTFDEVVIYDGDKPEYSVVWGAWVEQSGGSIANFAVQMVAAAPNYYCRAQLMEANRTSITIFANTQVNINGKGYINTEDVELSLDDVVAAEDRAGTDMYVYACEPESGTEPVFVLSQNSTVPDGYDAENSRKIGGFHCLCVAVGSISGHQLTGYAIGDIIPNSVWDLLFRATSENEGMVYIVGLGIWVDIYIASWDGSKLVSVYGGVAVTDSTGGKYMTGENFTEEYGLIGKRNLWRDEFIVVAKGSNETTNINGSANPSTVGGHVDTASRRMISHYGLEDCCGVWWQWTSDMFGIGNSAAMYRSSSSYTATNTSWAEIASRSDIDGSNNTYGQWYGCVGRFLVGGSYARGANSGSRCVDTRCFSTFESSYISSRGASKLRAFNMS